MNYRHAYHAGNFADVTKHALLLGLIRALQVKEGGCAFIDTHAGCGIYALHGVEAQKTQEWESGIGRVLTSGTDALRDYLQTIRKFDPPRTYPGSPALIAAALRPQDQLIACELHPDDATRLSRTFRGNPKVATHHRDGYASLRAFLPPRQQKRGLILMDPPFEKTDEFQRLADAIAEARTRFPQGIVAAWYPIKHRAPVRAFHDDLKSRGLRSLLACELLLRPALDPTRLNGTGLLIAGPPWKFEEAAMAIQNALRPLLSPDDVAEAASHVDWIVGE